MESDGDIGEKPIKHLGNQVCQICGDSVGTTVDGEPFVACDVCRFPVCRPCYEYERKDGNQSCPQCKTTYKRHKGLNGRMKGTPDWILSLDRLLSLRLLGSQIKDESFFEDLQLKLPNFKELYLADNAIEVAEWCFQRGSFPKLRDLSLFGLTKLRLIKVEEGAMPCILAIRLWDCKQLENEDIRNEGGDAEELRRRYN